jgi:hypothetical protein
MTENFSWSRVLIRGAIGVAILSVLHYFFGRETP